MQLILELCQKHHKQYQDPMFNATKDCLLGQYREFLDHNINVDDIVWKRPWVMMIISISCFCWILNYASNFSAARWSAWNINFDNEIISLAGWLTYIDDTILTESSLKI